MEEVPLNITPLEILVKKDSKPGHLEDSIIHGKFDSLMYEAKGSQVETTISGSQTLKPVNALVPIQNTKQVTVPMTQILAVTPPGVPLQSQFAQYNRMV